MPFYHSLVVIFDVIVLLAVLLCFCTLLPAIFSRVVHRSIGWYSLMTAWLVYSLSYGLLVGKQEGPEPPFGLCLVQTMLVYAVPPLVATGMLCYYIEFYLIVSGLRSGNPRPYSSWRTFWLVITPWLVFLAIILEVLLLIFPGKRLHLIERAENNFYCHLGDNIPNLVTASTVIAGMVVLLPLEVWTGYTMYRNWDIFKRLTRTDRQIFITVYLRLMLCTLAAVIAFAFSMLAFVFPAPDATSLVYPTLPIFIAFAFGTQKDLLGVWLFWRPHQPYGSIVFNNGGSLAITTNICTSWGAVSGVSTESESQSQVLKPNDTAVDQEGAATTLLKVPLTLNPTVPMEKPPASQTEASACPIVHFESPPNPQDIPSLKRTDHQIQASKNQPSCEPQSA